MTAKQSAKKVPSNIDSGNDSNRSKDLFIPEPISGRYDEQVELAWRDRLSDLPSKAIPLLALLDVTSSLVNGFHSRTLKQHGHNYSEYAILCTLLLNGTGVKPTDLTNMLRQPSAGTAQTLNKLESQGLIERQKNPKDRRSIFVTLTNDGIKTAETLCAAEAEASGGITKKLSKKELNELRAALGKIISIFK